MKALFLASLLLVLLPAAALAHGGQSHEADRAQDPGNATATDTVADRPGWSPLCPAGSGHSCGCGEPAPFEDAAEPGLAPRSTVSFESPRVNAPAFTLGAPLVTALRFAPELPRAPPALS